MALAPVVYDLGTNVHRPALSTEVVVPSNTPEGYSSGAAPPPSPIVGDRWRNTNALTVAGVPSGVTATWNGTSWDFVSLVAPPASVSSGSVL